MINNVTRVKLESMASDINCNNGLFGFPANIEFFEFIYGVFHRALLGYSLHDQY